MPKVSALLSVYNGESYINDAIKSVLTQTYDDFEFVIVNDGSTDNTLNIIKSYNDPRIVLLNLEENIGIALALNKAIPKLKGKYTIKIDGDDIQHSSRFERQITFMENNQSIDVAKSLFEFFPNTLEISQTKRYKIFKDILEKNKNEVYTSEEISKYLYSFCCIPHATMIIKTNILKKYKYRDLKVYEDYDLFYRMNRSKIVFGHINENLVKVRVSDNSTTAIAKKEIFNETIYTIKEDILKVFKKKENIYIWGAGSFGKEVLSILKDHHWEINGFIDSDKSKVGQIIEKLIVFDYEDIKSKYNLKFIVASQPGMMQIISQLEADNYSLFRDYIVFR